jgi:hypothetical protein
MNMRVLAVIGVVVFAGSFSVHAAYQTEVTVTPESEPHQYRAEFVITETGEDGKATVLAKPIVISNAGQEAQAIVGIDNRTGNVEAAKKNGVLCKALVKEMGTGVQATTTVTVNKNGVTMLRTVDNITVRK